MPHTTRHQATSPNLPTARIARSDRSRDGLILRDVATGRIGFLADPSAVAHVIPGQIYTYTIDYDAGSWYKATLLELIHGPNATY